MENNRKFVIRVANNMGSTYERDATEEEIREYKVKKIQEMGE